MMTEPVPEIQEKPIQPETVSEIPQNKNFFKTVLLVVLGLIVVAGAVYAGYHIGRKSVPPAQILIDNGPVMIEVSPTPDITANWKTYKDTNIFFLYPNEWVQKAPQILGSRTVREFTFQNTPLFTVSTIANYNNLTGKQYATLDEFLGVRSNQAKNTTINNYPAKRITDAGEEGHIIPYEEVVLFSPDKSFLLSFYYEKDYYEKPNTNKVFDQILSTFRFD